MTVSAGAGLSTRIDVPMVVMRPTVFRVIVSVLPSQMAGGKINSI